MMNVEVVTLEDNRECIILNEFILDNNKYVILVNTMNKDDFIFRKRINDKLVGLKDEEEFKKVFLYFSKISIKNTKGELNNE